MNPLEAFSSSDVIARERFRNACRERGAWIEAYPLGLAGKQREDLTIDVARFGRMEARRLLLVTSGLHGLEAPFGSAVQLAWLARLPRYWEPPEDLAVVLIHGLNPYGHRFATRWNEDRLDLNRNFLEPRQFAELRKESEESLYAAIDPYLNPPTAPQDWEGFLFTVFLVNWKYGSEAVRVILPRGQYAFPQGLFYGGSKPSRTVEIVSTHADSWIGSAEEILHLDFHTGLGRWATHKLLLDAKPGDWLERWGRRWFGDAIETPDGPTAYPIHGGMESWFLNRYRDRAYLSLTAEFGAYSPLTTLQALRNENRAFHWSEPDGPLLERTRQWCQEVFVPRSEAWRWSVVHQSLQILHLALNKWASPD